MNSTNENSSHTENHDYVFKFVIIGDSGVGKSCLIHHFMFNKCLIYLKIFNFFS
jgi:GTPase SAR1 family protein